MHTVRHYRVRLRRSRRLRYRLARLLLAAIPWLLIGVVIAYYLVAVR
jgi:hypothetical protein